MKKREFQKKVTAELFKKLVEVFTELGTNPNITVTSRNNSSYFKLRCQYSMIQISVKQTGELSYQLTDEFGSTGGRKIYYEYPGSGECEELIRKFVEDFGRFYKDFLLAETLHDFVDMTFSYDTDAAVTLEDFEYYINMGCL